MIEIRCSAELYTYNMYHITKAFFPGEQIVQQVVDDLHCAVRVILPDGTEVTALEQTNAGTEDKKQRKYEVDKTIYRAYESYTGRSLAWGLLTGVRPTKIAMQKVEDGMKEEEFVRWFGADSLVSEPKARLAYEIAQRERELLQRLDTKEGYSLYVGIPFCPSVCSYCSFSSGAIQDFKEEVDAYVDALCRELSYIGEQGKGKKLNTIYIGGGTPTTLSNQQLERLLSHIDNVFSRKDLLEYTVEAGRPDSITEEKLLILKDHKVTRISINPQTMQQETLYRIGRMHTVGEVTDAYHLARGLGFDNINMDLIVGLTGETKEDVADTLRQIAGLDPDSLTVHALAVKRAAKMGQERNDPQHLAQKRVTDAAMGQELSAMIAMAEKAARASSMSPYYLYRQKNIAGNFENVGYAKVDKAGIYNILIMEEIQSIIAAGAGASTKIVLKQKIAVPGSKSNRETTLMRVENVKGVREYIARIDEMIERKGVWLWR